MCCSRFMVSRFVLTSFSVRCWFLPRSWFGFPLHFVPLVSAIRDGCYPPHRRLVFSTRLMRNFAPVSDYSPVFQMSIIPDPGGVPLPGRVSRSVEPSRESCVHQRFGGPCVVLGVRFLHALRRSVPSSQASLSVRPLAGWLQIEAFSAVCHFWCVPVPLSVRDSLKVL